MLFGLTSQCFTGDTLVSTEDGLRPIEEIQAGDCVWSENTETGEKELKKVLAVSVTETDTLVHVTTGNGTEINTTENHPFYTEGKGWCAASELEEGDVLHTQDGKTETVASVETETLDEPVKVYNLEIEDSHTCYVSVDRVLVHNACGDEIADTINKNTGKDCEVVSKEVKKTIIKNGEHGEIIKIVSKNTNNIDSRIYNDIVDELVATNGYHFGVNYNGKVYDEYFPQGLKFDDWIRSFFAHGGIDIDQSFIEMF